MKKAALILPMMGLAVSLFAQIAPAPKIFLIGTTHHFHFDESTHYSLIDLQAQILALHPDVVCGEITSEAFNGPMEGNFPPEAAMLAELAPAQGVRFVAADWRVSFAWQARAEKQEAEDKEKFAEVEASQKKVRTWMEGFSGVSMYDYLNLSPQFQAMVIRCSKR